MKYRKIRMLKELNPGDHIQIPGGGGISSSSGGIYNHHLLVVAVINNRQIWVIHKTENGVVEEVNEYKPEEITVLDYNCRYSGDEAIRRARAMPTSSYDLLENNCEHFVFKARTGVKQSEQVKEVLKMGIVLSALAVLIIALHG